MDLGLNLGLDWDLDHSADGILRCILYRALCVKITIQDRTSSEAVYIQTFSASGIGGP